ncbi:MAG: hypothetical protein QM820_44400 [Minicystis sp.]
MNARLAISVISCVGLSFAAACSSGGQGTGGSGNSGTGGESSSSSTSSGQGGTSPSTSSSTSSGSATTSTSSSSTSSSSGSSDPLEAARQKCIDKMNELRATKGHPPLQRWKDAEPCVDNQANVDQQNKKPHGQWSTFQDACNGGGQNECLGQGAAGIESCLDQMWAEKDQAACSGCDLCLDVHTSTCPNCDKSGGSTGMVCGHYVNMAANYFTKAACGFSSVGGWVAINFE